MSGEAATRIDEGRQRLQAAAEPEPVKRTKNPVYAVFVENDQHALDCMTEQVAANSRKDAIRKAVEANGGKPESGRFLVVPVGSLSWHTRSTRTETAEVWE
jgi:hypothetical protein